MDFYSQNNRIMSNSFGKKFQKNLVWNKVYERKFCLKVGQVEDFWKDVQIESINVFWGV